ncbi:DNA repair protein RecN [Polycyclovorans algicola]|uniref:DNA repair protein RecN n=1 Tax=Polycyclovorans algicola TaxID=616992 RepID=UPI0004A722F8|nr:DNA repair protein RecN [Polycyclovorans algicola]
MLKSLTIQNFAIIDSVALEFGPGLTVLTGETGAGKSILIDALGLLAGARADSQMVRDGCEKADITATFELPPDDESAARKWLQAQSLVDEDDPDLVVLRRVILTEGRTRAFVNAQPVNASALRELGDCLIEIYGQSESQTLLRGDTQRQTLDAFGQHGAALAKVAAAAEALHETDALIESIRKQGQGDPARLDFLQFQIQELEALALQPDELPKLEAEHRRLANAGRLLEDGNLALSSLAGDDAAADAAISRAQQLLDALADLDPAFAELAPTLESARTQLQDVIHALRGALDRLDLDPGELARAERRMSAIHDTARKHRVRPEALAEHLETLREELDRNQNHEQRLASLSRQREGQLTTYQTVARALSKAREKSAKRLADGATPIVQGLGMANARFQIAVTADPRTPVRSIGFDEVSFEFSANPGQSPRPLSKVASGGELSRVSLALQVVAIQLRGVATMVFDEVDAGISGAVAERVGQELRALGTRRQVLCVTHQAQVAAQAHQHLSIHKDVTGGKTFTRVTPLDRSARIDALARLQGGQTITASARQLAAELLDQVAGDA